MLRNPAEARGSDRAREELCDLAADPWEEHDLSSVRAHAGLLDVLRTRIVELGQAARVDDRPPMTVPV